MRQAVVQETVRFGNRPSPEGGMRRYGCYRNQMFGADNVAATDRNSSPDGNHRKRPGEFAISIRRRWVCGWSRKPSTRIDTSAYHLFYADGWATPGTDLTFFDWPVGREQRGTHSDCPHGLRVSGAESLTWWRDHLKSEAVTVGRSPSARGYASLDFEDGEGQRFRLIDDGGSGDAHPWDKSPVPARAPDPRTRPDHA